LGSLATICWESGYPEAALDYGTEARRISKKDESTSAPLLSLTGFAQVEVGQFTDGIRTLSASLELHGAPAERASILTALGMAYRGIGEHDESIYSYKSAIALFRGVGDRAGEANAIGNLGNTYADLGQAQDAKQHLRAALEIWRQLGDRTSEALTLNNLAAISLDGRDREAARGHWEAAVAVLEDCGDIRWLQRVRANLAALPEDDGMLQDP
jgi:tetratricopeptide (TPR) repeat protein